MGAALWIFHGLFSLMTHENSLIHGPWMHLFVYILINKYPQKTLS